MGQLYQQGDAMIRKNPGADITQQLGNMYGQALEKALPQQQQQAPAGATPEQISKGLAPGARGNPAQNAQLRRQAETRPLYSKERMGQQLDQILSGKPLDEATRQIIRRTGMKPSEFFSRQMQLQGIQVDADTQKRLQELDGGDLVSQAPVGTGGFGMMPTNRYLPVAQRLGQQFAAVLNSAFTPPAAAAERGSSPFTGSASIPGGTAKVNQLIRLAQGAGFRGNDAAVMAAIALAESGGNVKALNDNRSTGDLSYGLWQINMIDDLGPERRRSFGIKNNEALWSPSVNAKAARLVHQSQGFGAWSVYKSGAYRQYLPAAQRALRGASLSR
jgi:hypothetical protein